MRSNNTEGDIWTTITVILFGLSLVDYIIIIGALASLAINIYVNRKAYKKHDKEEKAAEAQRLYYESMTKNEKEHN